MFRALRRAFGSQPKMTQVRAAELPGPLLLAIVLCARSLTSDAAPLPRSAQDDLVDHLAVRGAVRTPRVAAVRRALTTEVPAKLGCLQR